MKLKFKIIIPIIIAIIMSWVGNIYVFNVDSLEKPLLLKSYVGAPLAEGFQIELGYISNVYDEDDMISATFPEIKTRPFYLLPFDNSNIASSYRLNRIHIPISDIFLENGKRLIDTQEAENISVHKIKLITNTGKTFEYDLGEICFYNEMLSKNDTFQISMTGSNNLGKNTLKTNADIKITEISSPLSKHISQVCDVNINGKPLSDLTFPILLKAGDQIEVNYQFKNSSDIKPQYRLSKYFIPLEIKGIELKNSPVYANVYMDANMQYEITAKEVKILKKESR